MKIAHLISQYLPSIGGAQVCVHNVAIELIKKNDCVVVLTTSKDDTSKRYGYPVVRISHWYLRILRVPIIGKYFFWYKLSKLQKRYSFDIWQVTIGYPLGVYSVGFFRKNKIPCVLRCCGEDVQVNRMLSYGYRLSPHIDNLVKNTYRQFDRVVGMVEGIREEYHGLGIPDEKIRIIPNGVNLERFKEIGNKEAKKDKLGLKNKSVLLTVGRNHPKKGYNLIPNILERIYKKRQDVVWIVIGNGSKNILSSEAAGSVKKNLILIDEINGGTDKMLKELPSLDLIQYYQSADLFVLPSYMEIFSIVLIEANAAGLPVVTSNAPGCRDVIKDGYNGLLAEPGDYEMFAEKIVDLLDNKELYNLIRFNIAKDIKRYDWSAIADQYRELYEDVIRKNGR